MANSRFFDDIESLIIATGVLKAVTWIYGIVITFTMLLVNDKFYWLINLVILIPQCCTIPLLIALNKNEKETHVNIFPLFLYGEIICSWIYFMEAFLESADSIFTVSTAGHIVAVVFGFIFFVAWIILAWQAKLYAEDNMSAEMRREFDAKRQKQPRVVRA